MIKNEDVLQRMNKSSSENETARRGRWIELLKTCPIPEDELLAHLGLFIRRQKLSKMLFLNELYKMITGVHGVIMEFGVLWGQNLALFESLRGIYEPYNHTRKIIGFDTFEGFASLDEKDGGSELLKKGNYSVTQGYEEYLQKVLDCHEQESPIAHLKKYELIKGDATVTAPRYFEDHPETIIALAYFDFDVYPPTKKCLEIIARYVTKGTVIGFDELGDHDFPGETVALQEVFGLDRFAIKRSRYSSCQSYVVVT